MQHSCAVSLFAVAMISATPAHAELRTLPGGTTEIAVNRIGCLVVIDGQELMNGTCHHRLTNNADVFLTLPEAASQIVVSVSRVRQRRVSLWTESQGRQSLGAKIIVPEGECQRPNDWVSFCPCWANERVRICTWSLQSPSESPPRSIRDADSFPPPQPAAPPSHEEQSNEVYELMDKATRELEKVTRQPPVR
jgi:hypothetical protein